MIVSKVQKWGNSLAFRIPQAFSKELQLEANSKVEIKLDKEQLVIKPARKRYKLEDFLANITEENLHKEVSTGKAVGQEIW